MQASNNLCYTRFSLYPKLYTTTSGSLVNCMLICIADIIMMSSFGHTLTHSAGVINLGSGPLVTPTVLTPTLDTPPIDHTLNGERPERMREWLVRMINSGRFAGLEWIDQEQMIFRVPWIHAKKRDYNQERDAALFKEWAIHSGMPVCLPVLLVCLSVCLSVCHE